jgi:hypothetical protein
MKTAITMLMLTLTSDAFAQTLTSDFNSGSSGWTVVDVVVGSYSNVVNRHAAKWSETNGNPGGYISFTDLNSLLYLFDAPSVFCGDQSAHHGDVLSFDLRRSAGVVMDEHPDVVLVGSTLTLVIDAGPGPAVPNQWTSYSVALSEDAGWHVGTLTGPTPTATEFRTALSNIVALRIRGDFTGALDLTGLDNVTISESCPRAVIEVSEVSVCWLSKPNTVYQVDYRSDLTTNMWTPLLTNAVGNGARMCVYDRVTQPQRFYRVVCP